MVNKLHFVCTLLCGSKVHVALFLSKITCNINCFFCARSNFYCEPNIVSKWITMHNKNSLFFFFQFLLPLDVLKLNISECHFSVASLRHACTIVMLSNQHLDLPHLWSWMYYFGKAELLTKTDLDRFVNNILEELLFCVWKIFLFLRTAH